MNAASRNGQQPKTLDELAELTARTRAEAEKTRKSFMTSLAEDWTTGASTLVTRLVAERADVVSSLDVAEIAILEANLAMAIADGQATIPSAFGQALNVDTLAKSAKANLTGGVSVDMTDAVASLSRPLFSLLENAKLRPADIRRGRTASYNAFSAWDLDMAHKPAESTFTNAVERYGKAKLAHDAAVRKAASEQAAKRWEDIEPSAG